MVMPAKKRMSESTAYINTSEGGSTYSISSSALKLSSNLFLYCCHTTWSIHLTLYSPIAERLTKPTPFQNMSFGCFFCFFALSDFPLHVLQPRTKIRLLWRWFLHVTQTLGTATIAQHQATQVLLSWKTRFVTKYVLELKILCCFFIRMTILKSNSDILR